MMKTPEEIKKGLEHCQRITGCADCPYRGERCALQVSADTLAYIQQLEEGIDRIYNIANNIGSQIDHIGELAEMVPKWVNVEERLPEDNVEVLIYAIGNNENSIIAMTSYTHNMHGYNIEGWRSPWQYFFYEYKITHWMPLPEPPKEG